MAKNFKNKTKISAMWLQLVLDLTLPTQNQTVISAKGERNLVMLSRRTPSQSNAKTLLSQSTWVPRTDKSTQVKQILLAGVVSQPLDLKTWTSKKDNRSLWINFRRQKSPQIIGRSHQTVTPDARSSLIGKMAGWLSLSTSISKKMSKSCNPTPKTT